MKSLTWKDLEVDFSNFIESILRKIDQLGLSVSMLEMDHCGLRFADKNAVERIKSELISRGDHVISNEIVNGREIFIIKLRNPLKYGGFTIPCIELPFPTNEHIYPKDGWEHVEFVVPSKAESMEEFERYFFEYFKNISQEEFEGLYKLDMPFVENSLQPANPTLVFKIESMLTIKFHPRSIEEIVTVGPSRS